MAVGATMTVDGLEQHDVEFVMHSVRESFGELIIGRFWGEKEFVDAAFAAATVTINGELIQVVDVAEDEAVFRLVTEYHSNEF
jgi:hypothetical protein